MSLIFLTLRNIRNVLNDFLNIFWVTKPDGHFMALGTGGSGHAEKSMQGRSAIKQLKSRYLLNLAKGKTLLRIFYHHV